jgi:hypothetical protein
MAVARALSVIALLSTAFAAPVFARDASLEHSSLERSSHEHLRHEHLRIHRGLARHDVQDRYFRGAYNQRTDHFDPNPQFQRNTDDFRGRDPSRIGGEDPDLHPSAY